MPVIRYFPVFPENPTNPARTNILTGDVHINLRRWRQLPLHTRKYVLAHEQGHAKYHTLNELTADRYALEQLALKEPYSLRHYVESVSNVSYNNPERMKQAQYETLKIAAAQGSTKARELLARYPIANADGAEYTPDMGNINKGNTNSTHTIMAALLAVAVMALVVYIIITWIRKQ